MKKKTLIEQIKEWMHEHTDLPYNDDQVKTVHQFGFNDFCVFIQEKTCTAQYLRHGHPTILVEFKFIDLESFIEGYASILEKVQIELEKENQNILNSVHHWMYNENHRIKNKENLIVWHLIQLILADIYEKDIYEKDGTTTFIFQDVSLEDDGSNRKEYQISFFGSKEKVIHLDEEGLIKAYIGFETF